MLMEMAVDIYDFISKLTLLTLWVRDDDARLQLTGPHMGQATLLALGTVKPVPLIYIYTQRLLLFN